MQLTRKLRLILTFYKNFLILSLLIDLCCLYLFREYGFSIFAGLFWFKLLTLGLTYYFINSYKAKEYYYYLNSGVSKRVLWVSVLSFDFVLFIFLIIQLNHFR